MAQEDKELLLIDLCARLYTGTIVNYNNLEGCDYELNIRTLSNFPEEDLKCYLRPLSSMTEEEYGNMIHLGDCAYNYTLTRKGFVFGKFKTFTLEHLDWLNINHFDYRGLIPKGLALEAPDNMYNHLSNLN